VSNFALTTANLLPNRAAVLRDLEEVAGDDILDGAGGQVIVEEDAGDLIAILHCPQPPAGEHDAVDARTLMPAMAALAPVFGSTV
jgi:hypothetical protein